MLNTEAVQSHSRGRSAVALVVRSTPTLPTAAGALGAIAIAINAVRTSTSDLTTVYAAAIVVSTIGIGFTLDDPATETLAPSPTALPIRRSIRIAIAGTILATVWTAIVIVIVIDRGISEVPIRELIVEVLAVAAIGLATSATVQRRSGRDGGPGAALVVGVGPLLMSSLASSGITLFPSLAPGQPGKERWIWIAAAALLLLHRASRDPGKGAKQVRNRYRTPPATAGSR